MPTNPVQALQSQAIESMRLAAEAELALAAAGQTTISTWHSQAEALRFLNGIDKKSEEQTKKLSKGTQALGKAFGDIQKSGLIAAATLTGTFAELRHLTASAQPGMLRAMDGAFQILTAELGSALLPAAMSVTDEILNLADWFANLDETTQKLIAAGALAVPAMIGLSHAVIALGPAARLAGLGIKALYASLGPVGALVAAIGVAAAGAAASAAAYSYYVNAGGHASPEKQEKAGQTVSQAELQHALDLERSQYGIFHGAAERAEDVQKESPEQLRERAGSLRAKAEEYRISQQFYEQAAKLEEAAIILERAATVGTTSREEEEREKKQTSLTRQAKHLNMMITEAQRVQQPKYSGLAEARKSLQLGILGKSPFEQKLLEIQRQNVPKMRQRLDSILRQLEEMNNRDRRQV